MPNQADARAPRPPRSTRRLVLRLLRAPLILIALIVVVGGGTYLFAPAALLHLNQWRQAMTAQLDHRTVQIGDTRWSYYEGGNGATIVLLHDFDGDKTTWLPLAQHLGAHFHLIVPDLPGWGASTRHAEDDYGIAAQAKRLNAFIATLQLGHVVLVGHGMGGAIAGVCATAHPAHVGELILIETTGLKSTPTAFEQAVRAGKDPYVLTDRADFDALRKALYATPPTLAGRFVDALVARSQANRAFLDRTLTELNSPAQRTALHQRLRQLRMPVLGLWCAGDHVVDPSALDSLRNGLSHASTISTSIINGCGHMPQREKPRAVAQIISGFVIAH